MLSLPPIPSADLGKEAEVFCGFLLVTKKLENAGHSFFETYERINECSEAASTSKLESNDDANNNGGDNTGGDTPPPGATNRSRREKGAMPNCSARVRKVIQANIDLYAALGVQEDCAAAEIKRAYRQQVLIHHPDKKKSSSSSSKKLAQQSSSSATPSSISISSSSGLSSPKVAGGPTGVDEESSNRLFLNIQDAYEILNDPQLRMQYDSALPFDDSVPKISQLGPSNFVQVAGEFFARNKKWSLKVPTPAPLAECWGSLVLLKDFYSFWLGFETRRDFGVECEFDLSEADSREERRWMERQNAKQARQLAAQENQRVRGFAQLAQQRDPQLRRFQDELKKKLADERQKKEVELKQKTDLLKKQEEEAKEKEDRRLKQEQEDIRKGKQARRLRINEIKKILKDQYFTKCLDNEGFPIRSSLPSITEFDYIVTNNDDLNDLEEFLITSNPHHQDGDNDDGDNDDGDNIIRNIEAKIFTYRENKRLKLQARSAPSINLQPSDTTSNPSQPVKNPQQGSTGKPAPSASPSASPAASPATSQAAPPPSTHPSVVPSSHPSEWTVDEISLLAKGLQKFPAGVGSRWEKVAKFVGGGRKPDELAAKAKEMHAAQSMKNISESMNSQAFDQYQKKNENVLGQIDTPIDRREISTTSSSTGSTGSTGSSGSAGSTEWTGDQQKQLEKALAKNPAANFSTPKERWTAISKDVSNKTPQDCIERFKEIRNAIKAAKG